MKRAILLSFLVLGIVGSTLGAVAFNLETRNGSKQEIVDIIGDRSSLKDIKMKQNFYVTPHTKKTTLITKEGIKDEKFENAYEEAYLKDKKLFRELISGIGARSVSNFSFSENGNESVVVSNVYKKGIFVRYKKDGKYKEFYIKEDSKKYDGHIGFTFLKDNVVYTIYQDGNQKYYFLKIDVNSEKLLKTIDMDSDVDIYVHSDRLRKSECVIRDNKLYIPALTKDRNIKVFCYNLLNDTLDFKDIVAGIDNNQSFNIFLKNEKFYITKVSSDKEELTISNYDITNGEVKNRNFNTSSLKEKYFHIFDLKETEDSFYLSGELIEDNKAGSNFIMNLDKDTSKTNYFGKISDEQRFFPHLTIQ